MLITFAERFTVMTNYSYKYIVIHFGEIWLKGGNRNIFINRLRRNIADALKGTDYASLDLRRDRFMVELNEGSDIGMISARLSKVFGISWFAPAILVKSEIGEMFGAVGKLASEQKRKAVRIVVRRSYKEGKNSMEILKELLDLANRKGMKMDKDSERVINVNITDFGTLVYADKIRGPGGLPVGVSGKAVVLLSGGIDSPVAAYYAMKRGLTPIYLHFHPFASNKIAEESKIAEFGKELSGYSNGASIYYAKADFFQSAVIKMSSRYEHVLFKRFMYKIAERIAKKEGAEVICTGESLAQVASQTVKNMRASEKGIRLLMLRPLSGFDKQEIVDKAQSIGTFETSIKPYKDVCSMHIQNPSTSMSAELTDALYRKYGIAKVVQRTMKSGVDHASWTI